MKHMASYRRALPLCAALLLLFLSVTLLAPPSADALPECGTRYIYYNDSNHTYNVGSALYDCNWNLVSYWGIVTGWYDTYQNLYCCVAE
jgi:hypothetical protein